MVIMIKKTVMLINFVSYLVTVILRLWNVADDRLLYDHISGKYYTFKKVY